MKRLIAKMPEGLDFEENPIRVCPKCKETVYLQKVRIPVGERAGEYIEQERGCKCEEIMMVKQLKEQHDKRRIMSFFDRYSLSHQGYIGCTLDNYRPENETEGYALEESLKFVQQFSVSSPSNLLYVGKDKGVGKSHLAYAVLHELLEKGYTGVFLNVPALFRKIRSTYHSQAAFTEDQLIEALIEADVLVLDEIGGEYKKDSVLQDADNESEVSWGEERLYDILDARQQKHNIFTSNLPSSLLESKVGPKNFSRILFRATVMNIKGEDRRMRQVKFRKEGVDDAD